MGSQWPSRSEELPVKNQFGDLCPRNSPSGDLPGILILGRVPVDAIVQASPLDKFAGDVQSQCTTLQQGSESETWH